MKITVAEIGIATTIASMILATMMLNVFSPQYYWLETGCALAIFLLLCVLLISALVQTEARRALSIGFLVPTVVYGITLIPFADSAFDPYARQRHASSAWLMGFHRSIARDVVIDLETGEEIERFKNLPLADRAKRKWAFGKFPADSTFLRYGHVLISLVLGYAGSFVGRFLYQHDRKCRRTKA